MQVTRRRAIEQAISNTVKFRRFWRTKVNAEEVDLSVWDWKGRACLGGWAARFFTGDCECLGINYTGLYQFGARNRPTRKTRLAQGKADWQEGDDRLTAHLRQLRRLLKP